MPDHQRRRSPRGRIQRVIQRHHARALVRRSDADQNIVDGGRYQRRARRTRHDCHVARAPPRRPSHAHERRPGHGMPDHQRRVHAAPLDDPRTHEDCGARRTQDAENEREAGAVHVETEPRLEMGREKRLERAMAHVKDERDDVDEERVERVVHFRAVLNPKHDPRFGVQVSRKKHKTEQRKRGGQRVH